MVVIDGDGDVNLPFEVLLDADDHCRLAGKSQIEGIENKIRIARSDYIQSVRQYNTELTTIPGRWWRAFMYPDKVELATFDIPAEEMTTPKVDFGTGK